MRFPTVNNLAESRSMIDTFAGLNRTTSNQDGEFLEMTNMSARSFPAMSPRLPRKKIRNCDKINGIIDKESLVWIDEATLYIDGEAVALADGVEIATDEYTLPKQMVKMGAYICIFPDGIWYNTKDATSGYMNASKSYESGASISFSLVNTKGENITAYSEDYWKSHTPTTNSYKITEIDGKTSLSVYYETTQMWTAIGTTYMKISATGIGLPFDKEDGIKITIDNSQASWAYADKIFVNKEADGKLSINTFIYNKGDDYIIIPALLNSNVSFTNLPMDVERKVPEMAYVTECQNRIWGCSKDGHEIYCCKLGDVKNWNCFQGISTDSYAATVGSDGVFTGAITYQQNPIFFKEDSILRVSVSNTGAHSYRELQERGVQLGSYRSLCIVGGILYYKSRFDVCAYDGSMPTSVSTRLGNDRYSDAVGGSIEDRYYLSMTDHDGKPHLFTYETKKGIWCREDSSKVDYFCRFQNGLYMVIGNTIWSVDGAQLPGHDAIQSEKPVEWLAESGNIGYENPDHKYIQRITIRIRLALGSWADVLIAYDDSNEFKHLCNLSGRGTASMSLSVTPHRCDHFRLKLTGRGDATLYSITKTMVEGSDGY